MWRITAIMNYLASLKEPLALQTASMTVLRPCLSVGGDTAGGLRLPRNQADGGTALQSTVLRCYGLKAALTSFDKQR